MTHPQRPDAESLRLELQEAIITFRHQIALTIQAFGILVTADSLLLAYGFSQRQAGVLLIASLMPIAMLIIFAQIMNGLIPISYVAMKLEQELSLSNAPLITTWVRKRDDLPFLSLGEKGSLDEPELPSVLSRLLPLHLLKSHKTYLLLAAFIAQLSLCLISALGFNYRFM